MRTYHAARLPAGGYAIQVVEQSCERRTARWLAAGTGQGPGLGADLAPRLLADALGEAYLGRPDLCRAFEREVVAALPDGAWQLTASEILLWALAADQRIGGGAPA
jgi:hypothetical protein